MRSYAREVAFCKIYSYLISERFDEDFSQFDKEKLAEEDERFAIALVQGVIEEKETLDKIISDLSKGFKLSRIYRPDLALLEMAIWEIRHLDTPVPVAINEAVSLAKAYSTAKSVSYVNGILASYARSLQ